MGNQGCPQPAPCGKSFCFLYFHTNAGAERCLHFFTQALDCPSTSVLLRVEPILYRQSYCPLALPRIHLASVGQEDGLDGF
jgi:hypothetical protein